MTFTKEEWDRYYGADVNGGIPNRVTYMSLLGLYKGYPAEQITNDLLDGLIPEPYVTEMMYVFQPDSIRVARMERAIGRLETLLKVLDERLKPQPTTLDGEI